MKLSERDIAILGRATTFGRFRPTDAERFSSCRKLVELGLLQWHDDVEPTYYTATRDGEDIAREAALAPKSARFYVVKAA